MKKYFTLLAVLVCTLTCFGQNNDKVWAFGDSCGIDFNTTPPTSITTAITGYEGTASISDANGQLLFYTDGRKVWDRNHMVMPNGTGLMPSNPYFPTTTQQTGIANIPGSDHLYYLFSLDDGNNTPLTYSIVNMTLNGGMGDIVPGQKGIPIDSFLAEKMLLVAGNNCDIWLVARSLIPVSCYKSYRITANGINTAPVISMVGTLPIPFYQYGYMVASPDRTKIASAVRDIELCDFNATTGVLSNARIITGPVLPQTFFYGVSFSPDNSKLYAANILPGVEQYDLNQPTIADVIASRVNITTDYVRSLRLGPDGKIYMLKETTTTMRAIEFPNLAGTACQYNNNVMQLAPGTASIIGLPNYNVVLQRDSVNTKQVHYNCSGGDPFLLLPTNSGIDYQWNDNSTDTQRTVSQTGTYVLRYHFLCTYYCDSFIILPRPAFPEISLLQHSCTGQQNGRIVFSPQSGDTTTYTYTWTDNLGNLLQQHVAAGGDQLQPAFPGNYYIRISTADSCDTVINVTVNELAAPVVAFNAGTNFCAGEPVHFTNGTTGLPAQFHWDFGDQTYSTQFSPDHTYGQPGPYTVVLIADNGPCSDTVFQDITIYDFDLSLTADKSVVNFKESFTLQTAAAESYNITAWMPSGLFPDQQALQQYRSGDTTMTYVVTGYSSAHQCIDTASVEVIVNPFINMPSAFSPNGDGLNDYFAPLVWGSDPGIKRFMVYDRWGKKVWSGTGVQALKGWDGLYMNGGRATVGTYYWYIELSQPASGKKSFKGDVTLMR